MTTMWYWMLFYLWCCKFISENKYSDFGKSIHVVRMFIKIVTILIGFFFIKKTIYFTGKVKIEIPQHVMKIPKSAYSS